MKQERSYVNQFCRSFCERSSFSILTLSRLDVLLIQTLVYDVFDNLNSQFESHTHRTKALGILHEAIVFLAQMGAVNPFVV